MCHKDLIPLNLLIMLADQLLRFRKQHLFQLKQFLLDGSKCHFLFEKRVITERLLDALDIYSSEDPK